MNPAIVFSDGLIRAIGWTLLHSLWQGFLILAVVAILLWLLGRQSSLVRYNLLCIAMLFMLASAITTFFLVLPEDRTSTATAVPELALSIRDAASVQPVAADRELPAIRSLVLEADHFLEKNNSYLVFIWSFGCLFFLLRYLGGLVYLNRLKTNGARKADGGMETKIRHLAARLGVAKRVDLLWSVRINVPMTIGHLKPVILIPAGMIGSLPPEQIDAILMHEMAHIFRRDYLVNTLQTFMEAIFFYHPAIWILSARIRGERENICDDIAVRHLNDPLTYIKALTAMEELKSTLPVMASAFAGNKKQLLSRVRRMVMPAGRNFRPAESLLSALALVILALLLGLGATINPSRAGASPDAFTAINPDAIHSLSGVEQQAGAVDWPSDAGRANDAQDLDPSPGYLVSDAIREPDTSKNAAEKAKQLEQQAAMEEAQKNLQKALEDKQAALDAYHDALEDYQEALHDIQMEKQELFLEYNFQIDSLDSLGVYRWPRMPEMRGVYDYYYFNEPFEGPWPGVPDCPEPGPGNIYFHFDSEDLPEIYDIPDGNFLEQFMEEEELKQIQRQFEWQERDQEGREREIEKRIIITSPDVHAYALPPAAPERLERYKSPEHIIRQELAGDGLISRGKGYIVEISSSSMYINGVKQSRDVFKKYKRLYESLTDETIQGDYACKMVF